MSLRVFKLPGAFRDLFDICEYIAQDNPDAARRFLVAAEREFSRIAEAPAIGSPFQSENPKLRSLRSRRVRGFHNYLVFYRFTDTEVEVVRVLHGARDLEGILGE